MAAHRAPVDAAPQTFLSQPPLDRGRAISAVRPHVLGRVRWIENVVELLTVVHRRIGYIPFADQLVRLVDADVVLVSVETLVVLLGPPRIDILLGELSRLLLPLLRRLVSLDRLVLLFRVVLPRYRHVCAIDDLAAARNVA